MVVLGNISFKLLPILSVDIYVLVSIISESKSTLPYVLVYWNVFKVVESVLKFIDSNSPLFDTLKNLIAQVFHYLKCFIFIILVMITCLHLFMYIVTFDNNLQDYSLGWYVGIVLGIVADSQWMKIIDQFSKAYERYSPIGVILTKTLVYLIQFILKHLIFSFFFGFVVSSI